MESHGGYSLAVDCRRKRSQHCDEREDTENRAYSFWLRECGTVGHNCTIAANLAFGAVGKYTKDSFALEIRDRKSNGRNVGDIVLTDRNDTAGGDWNTAVCWT